MALSPGLKATAVCLLVALGGCATGYLVGVAGGRFVNGLLALAVVVAVGGVLLGVSYYASGVGELASVTPVGIIIVAIRSQVVSPQFTSNLSTTLAWVSTPLWVVLCVGLALRRLRRAVL
jgi:hypothetical protein